MTNKLCKLEGGQGYVIVLPLVQKAVQSMPLGTLCPLNGPGQTLCCLFLMSCNNSPGNAIIDSFDPTKRLVES